MDLGPLPGADPYKRESTFARFRTMSTIPAPTSRSVWSAMLVSTFCFVLLVPAAQFILLFVRGTDLPLVGASEWLLFLLTAAAVGVFDGIVWHRAQQMTVGWRRAWLESFVPFLLFNMMLHASRFMSDPPAVWLGSLLIVSAVLATFLSPLALWFAHRPANAT